LNNLTRAAVLCVRVDRVVDAFLFSSSMSIGDSHARSPSSLDLGAQRSIHSS